MPDGVIPGQTLGTTAPTFSGPSGLGGPVPDPNDKAKQILDMIVKASSQRRFAGQPRPSPIPGFSDPAEARQIGMNTSNPHAWGAERFMAGLQGMMRNAVAMSKERQINKAMADWDYAQSSLNEYYSIDQQNPQAIQQWHQKYDWFWQDEKKLKNMAKSLNQDWLNPEKTTVHGEALKRKAAQVEQTSQKKSAARTGISNMFKSLLGRQQQTELSSQEKAAQAQEIIGRAPTSSGTTDPKAILEIAQAQDALAKAKESERLASKGSTIDEQIADAARRSVASGADPSKDPLVQQLTKVKQDEAKPQKPVDKVLSEAAVLFEKGDMEGYKNKLAEAQGMSTATKAPAKDTEITLLQKAQGGDPEAVKTLNAMQKRRIELAIARGQAYQGAKPLNYYDPEIQRNITLGAGMAEALQAEGKVLIPTGTVPATQIANMQRALSVIPKRVEDVRKYLKVWDDPKDAAIFGKILKETPMGSDPSSWFTNVLNRALSEKLSDDGKKAVVSLRVLNEGMGTVRAQSQLPSTVGSMMATAALIPGPQTADSKMAANQLDHILELVQAEAGLPFYGMEKIDITGKDKAGTVKITAPPKGAKVRDYTQVGTH